MLVARLCDTVLPSMIVSESLLIPYRFSSGCSCIGLINLYKNQEYRFFVPLNPLWMFRIPLSVCCLLRCLILSRIHVASLRCLIILLLSTLSVRLGGFSDWFGVLFLIFLISVFSQYAWGVSCSAVYSLALRFFF